MIPHLAFHPPVIAHRGASQAAPENSLAAIRAAREQGVNWLELDVKITYDGVPILMHDETLNRTTNGQGLVADKTWEEMSQLKLEKSLSTAIETVPHLSEALNTILQNKLSLIVELKPCPGRAKATTMVAMIEMAKIWPEGDVFPVVSSFDLESLEIAAQLEPHWPRGLLMDQWDPNWQEGVERIKASALSIEESQLTQDRVASVVSQRLPLLAYTVNDPARAKELLAWGVSAVYADNPRSILAAL